MGKRPLARDGPASRETILAAAERTFAEAGLSGARVDRIARRAHVNKALLYYYFRSKEGLYRAVLEEHLREFAREAREVLEAQGDARSKVLGFVSAHFDFLSVRPLFPSLMQRFFMTGGRSLDRLKAKYVLPTYRGLIRIAADTRTLAGTQAVYDGPIPAEWSTQRLPLSSAILLRCKRS